MMISLGLRATCFEQGLTVRLRTYRAKLRVGQRSRVLATRTCCLGAIRYLELDEGPHFVSHAPRLHMLSRS